MTPAGPWHRLRRPHLGWWIALIVAVLFGAAQLIPYGVSNPKVVAEPHWDSPRTRQLAVAACYDCHSNQSRRVWYESIAPIKWWIARHVREGRRRLNFSEWPTQRVRGALRAARTVERKSMPPSYYTWFGLHSAAKLSKADAQALAQGLDATATADPPGGGGSAEER